VTVVGTFSKSYGLAGLPTGYAIATPARAKALRELLIASHVGAGLSAAIALYRDRAHLDVSNRAVAQGRAVVEAACRAVGWRTLPSVGSYVFAEIGPRAAPVMDALAKQGVILRQFGTDHPTWARIAVREAPALAAFVKALPQAAKA
jgi:histidinol-phosphate aminotransferase